jgi:hypothetical protein
MIRVIYTTSPDEGAEADGSQWVRASMAWTAVKLCFLAGVMLGALIRSVCFLY